MYQRDVTDQPQRGMVAGTDMVYPEMVACENTNRWT